MRTLKSAIAIGLLTFGLALSATAAPVRDLVLMLDNSKSMRKADAMTSLRRIAGKFIRDVETDSRLAVGLFGERAEFLWSLTGGADLDRSAITRNLQRINYRSKLRNIPEAITMAIDELKHNNKPGTLRAIVVLTDGMADTGDNARDRLSRDWLRDVVAHDAASSDIKFFGIGLAADADEELLRALAESTGGAFFSARRTDELPDILGRIELLSRPPKHGEEGDTPGLVEAGRITEAAKTAAGKSNAPEPVVTSVTAKSSNMNANGSAPLLAANSRLTKFATDKVYVGSALFALMLCLLLWSVFRHRSPAAVERPTAADGDEESSSAIGAYLIDVNNLTGHSRYGLRSTRTMIGRVPPFPEEGMESIVIDLPTVGRRHALIEHRMGEYWIFDQGSRNGTFVNGQRVRDAAYLMHGDKVRLHNVELEFAIPGLGYADITLAYDDVPASIERRETEPAIAGRSAATQWQEEVSGDGSREAVARGSARTAKERLFAEVSGRGKLQ